MISKNTPLGAYFIIALFLLFSFHTLNDPVTYTNAQSPNSLLEPKYKLNDTIKVGVDENYPPHEWSYYDKINNVIAVKGYNVDVMREIAKRIGINVVFYPMKWRDAVDSLKNGSVDALFMAFSEERKKFFDFSESILDIKLGLFVSKDTTGIYSFSDLNNHTVAVEKGDIAEIILKAQAPNAIIVEVDNQEQGLEILNKKEVFAFIGNFHTCWYFITSNGFKGIKQVGDSIPIGNRSIAVSKGNYELLSVLNQTIIAMKSDGTLHNIIAKWFSPSSGPHMEPTTIYIVVGIIGGLCLIAALSVGINVFLKRLINRKTKEIKDVKNRIELINDLLAHDMNNTFNILLNVTEIMETEYFNDAYSMLLSEYKSYLLESIYKITMARELMLLLNTKKMPSFDVEINQFVASRVTQIPFELKRENPFVFISNLERQLYVPFNSAIDILFSFLIFKVLQEKKPIILIETIERYNQLIISFFFNTKDLFLPSERSIELYGRENLPLIFLLEAIASINAIATISKDCVSIIFSVSEKAQFRF